MATAGTLRKELSFVINLPYQCVLCGKRMLNLSGFRKHKHKCKQELVMTLPAIEATPLQPVMLQTRSVFIALYREELFSRYEWATDMHKLLPFMESVRNTINDAGDWSPDSDAARIAWLKMGNDGTPTIKDIRALPE